VIVLRLGRIVKDAPTSQFNGDTLVGMITGSITTLAADKE
jgi:simple sugar transport system ATP-binding protein